MVGGGVPSPQPSRFPFALITLGWIRLCCYNYATVLWSRNRPCWRPCVRSYPREVVRMYFRTVAISNHFGERYAAGKNGAMAWTARRYRSFQLWPVHSVRPSVRPRRENTNGRRVRVPWRRGRRVPSEMACRLDIDGNAQLLTEIAGQDIKLELELNQFILR